MRGRAICCIVASVGISSSVSARPHLPGTRPNRQGPVGVAGGSARAPLFWTAVAKRNLAAAAKCSVRAWGQRGGRGGRAAAVTLSGQTAYDKAQIARGRRQRQPETARQSTRPPHMAGSSDGHTPTRRPQRAWQSHWPRLQPPSVPQRRLSGPRPLPRCTAPQPVDARRNPCRLWFLAACAQINAHQGPRVVRPVRRLAGGLLQSSSPSYSPPRRPSLLFAHHRKARLCFPAHSFVFIDSYALLSSIPSHSFRILVLSTELTSVWFLAATVSLAVHSLAILRPGNIRAAFAFNPKKRARNIN